MTVPRTLLSAALVLAAGCLPTAVRAQSPAPAASASAAPGAKPSAAASGAATRSPADYPRDPQRVHRAIVVCDYAPFYSWPSQSSAPAPASYPPARSGDAFQVIGDGTLTYNALTLYETTIDVVAPYGSGKHYWISARCVNAG